MITEKNHKLLTSQLFVTDCTKKGLASMLIAHLINIDYYMAFFVSYPLSALGHYISPRANRLEGWYMNEADKGYDMKN